MSSWESLVDGCREGSRGYAGCGSRYTAVHRIKVCRRVPGNDVHRLGERHTDWQWTGQKRVEGLEQQT